MKKVIVVSGPTASGKSDLAIKIALAIDAEIVNADSFQVYRQVNAGINKPSKKDLEAVKHHLINCIDVDQEWSIADFLKHANRIIDESKKSIVVVGGSTLYVDALINNYDLNEKKRNNKFNHLTCQQLWTRIEILRPELLNESIKNNYKRLTRMYENILDDNINRKKEPKYNFFHIFVNIERKELYQKINQRAQAMLDSNWSIEVRWMSQLYDIERLNAFKAIGYLPIYKNRFVIDQNVIELIKKQTRRYAKRQLTWCKNKFKFDFEYQDSIQDVHLITMVKNWLQDIKLPTSLYIHIPFCKSICTYCDFKREIYQSENVATYLKKLMLQLKGIKQKQKTIYLGGGTPNVLTNLELNELLKSLQHLIDDDTEFSIELNPELITNEQIDILVNNGINRISLGVQSLNDDILKIINRQHTKAIVIEKIKMLQAHFHNISCDFIYNLPNMTAKDIDNIIEFVNNYDIKHVSFYALEIKDGAILKQANWKINEEVEEEQMSLIIDKFHKKTQLHRYEVSNWAADEKYYAKHNLVYWNMKQWHGIGVGATGFYENQYLSTKGDNLNYHYYINSIEKNDYYQDIIIMGLRQIKGINLKDPVQYAAYCHFKEKIGNFLVIENDYAKVKNVDLLNEVIIKII